MNPSVFAVIAVAPSGATVACSAWDTEQEARADLEARAPRYPAWDFMIREMVKP
jgi:hypothetical protein